MQGRQIIFLSVLTTPLWAAALRQTRRPLYGVWSCRIGVEWTESLHMVTQTSSWSPLFHCPALLSRTRYSSCKENTEKVGVQEALRLLDGRERGKNLLFWCCLLVAFKGSKGLYYMLWTFKPCVLDLCCFGCCVWLVEGSGNEQVYCPLLPVLPKTPLIVQMAPLTRCIKIKPLWSAPFFL